MVNEIQIHIAHPELFNAVNPCPEDSCQFGETDSHWTDCF